MECSKNQCRCGIPILYYNEFSPQARSCYMLIRMLDIDVEVRYKKYTLSQLQFAPACRVPNLIDGKFILNDGHTIMIYLCDKYALLNMPHLCPRDYLTRLQLWNMLFYEAGVLYPLQNNMLTEILLKKYENIDLDYHLEKVNDSYNTLNKFVEHQTFMLGNCLTIADFSLVTTVATLDLMFPINKNQWPNLHRWFEHLKYMECYKYNAEGIQKQRQFLQTVGEFPFSSPLAAAARAGGHTSFQPSVENNENSTKYMETNYVYLNFMEREHCIDMPWPQTNSHLEPCNKKQYAMLFLLLQTVGEFPFSSPLAAAARAGGHTSFQPSVENNENSTKYMETNYVYLNFMEREHCIDMPWPQTNSHLEPCNKKQYAMNVPNNLNNIEVFGVDAQEQNNNQLYVFTKTSSKTRIPTTGSHNSLQNIENSTKTKSNSSKQSTPAKGNSGEGKLGKPFKTGKGMFKSKPERKELYEKPIDRFIPDCEEECELDQGMIDHLKDMYATCSRNTSIIKNSNLERKKEDYIDNIAYQSCDENKNQQEIQQEYACCNCQKLQQNRREYEKEFDWLLDSGSFNVKTSGLPSKKYSDKTEECPCCYASMKNCKRSYEEAKLTEFNHCLCMESKSDCDLRCPCFTQKNESNRCNLRSKGKSWLVEQAYCNCAEENSKASYCIDHEDYETLSCDIEHDDRKDNDVLRGFDEKGITNENQAIWCCEEDQVSMFGFSTGKYHNNVKPDKLLASCERGSENNAKENVYLTNDISSTTICLSDRDPVYHATRPCKDNTAENKHEYHEATNCTYHDSMKPTIDTNSGCFNDNPPEKATENQYQKSSDCCNSTDMKEKQGGSKNFLCTENEEKCSLEVILKCGGNYDYEEETIQAESCRDSDHERKVICFCNNPYKSCLICSSYSNGNRLDPKENTRRSEGSNPLKKNPQTQSKCSSNLDIEDHDRCHAFANQSCLPCSESIVGKCCCPLNCETILNKSSTVKIKDPTQESKSLEHLCAKADPDCSNISRKFKTDNGAVGETSLQGIVSKISHTSNKVELVLEGKNCLNQKNTSYECFCKQEDDNSFYWTKSLSRNKAQDTLNSDLLNKNKMTGPIICIGDKTKLKSLVKNSPGKDDCVAQLIKDEERITEYSDTAKPASTLITKPSTISPRGTSRPRTTKKSTQDKSESKKTSRRVSTKLGSVLEDKVGRSETTSSSKNAFNMQSSIKTSNEEKSIGTEGSLKSIALLEIRKNGSEKNISFKTGKFLCNRNPKVNEVTNKPLEISEDYDRLAKAGSSKQNSDNKKGQLENLNTIGALTNDTKTSKGMTGKCEVKQTLMDANKCGNLTLHRVCQTPAKASGLSRVTAVGTATNRGKQAGSISKGQVRKSPRSSERTRKIDQNDRSLNSCQITPKIMALEQLPISCAHITVADITTANAGNANQTSCNISSQISESQCDTSCEPCMNRICEENQLPRNRSDLFNNCTNTQ